MDEFINSLTSEEYISFLDKWFGEIPAEIDAMSDDEILAELGV